MKRNLTKPFVLVVRAPSCTMFPRAPTTCHITNNKAFDKLYVCFAAADEALLLPSLERFKRLGIANVTWRLERDDGKEQHDAKKLIRDCAAFQICWSMSAKVRPRSQDRSQDRTACMHYCRAPGKRRGYFRQYSAGGRIANVTWLRVGCGSAQSKSSLGRLSAPGKRPDVHSSGTPRCPILYHVAG